MHLPRGTDATNARIVHDPDVIRDGHGSLCIRVGPGPVDLKPQDSAQSVRTRGPFAVPDELGCQEDLSRKYRLQVEKTVILARNREAGRQSLQLNCRPDFPYWPGDRERGEAPTSPSEPRRQP
jgi:hypothetical protein